MYSHLLKPAGLALVAISLATQPAVAQREAGTVNTAEPLDWDALLDETEEILDWGDEPLEEFLPEDEPMSFWSLSLRAGGGQSDNFLKRPNPVSSRFLKAEGDVFLNTLFEKASLTALLYAEYSLYERDAEAHSETLAFLHVNGTRFLGDNAYGVELGAFYGDQVYDASLTVDSEPLGTNLRQFRPQAEAFFQWQPGRRDALRTAAGLVRATFGDSDDDYWQPSLSLEWTHAWAPGWVTATEISAYREYYDVDVPRTAAGLPLDARGRLEVGGLSIEETVKWEDAILQNLDLSLRAGAAIERDDAGQYQDLQRYWSSLSASYEWRETDFSVSGRWQNTRYDDRQAAILDPRPLRHTYRNLKVEISRGFPWNTSLKARVQWTDFHSRNNADDFSERRIEILLGWTY